MERREGVPVDVPRDWDPMHWDRLSMMASGPPRRSTSVYSTHLFAFTRALILPSVCDRCTHLEARERGDSSNSTSASEN